MKKILYSAAALALAFFAGSCQQENLEPVVSGNTVTYTVQVADAVATRALGDDITAVNELVYEVYRTKEEETTSFTDVDHLLYHKTAEVKNGVATIEIEFVNDQNFTVLFWAHVQGNDVYDVDDLTAVTITSPDDANNVNAQAFVGRDFVRDCVSDNNGKVTLVRPVSQLNIATTPESLVFEAEAGETGSTVRLEGSSVKVTGLATSYNIATLSAFGAAATEYTYTETAVPADVLTVNGKNYTYVAMNYVGFAPEMGTSDVTVSYVINTSEGDIDNEILNVPVKPNYRTNIVGNLITSKTQYEITLDKTWAGENIIVNNAEEFAAALDRAEAGDVIALADGEYDLPSALFGQASSGTFTIAGNGVDTEVNGAVNANANAPGVYANGKHLVFKDLTYITPNNGYNGGFGHAASVTFINCTIIGQFYAHSEAPHYFYDCTIDPLTGYLYTYGSDCVFEGCTFAASEGKALQVYEDGTTGENTVTIKDCHFVAAKQAATWDGKPVTGIDINSNGAIFNVYVENCTTTGFPTGLNSGSDLYNIKDGGLTRVNLWIDGVQVAFVGMTPVAAGVNKDAEGKYYVSTASGLKHMNNIFANQTAGRNVVMNLAADIDFSGYTWNTVDSHADASFQISMINGNGHTITNFTINGQAMFRRFAGSGDVVVKDITFDRATVNSSNLNTSLLTVQTYQNVLLDNVDVKNSTFTGTYKVAPLLATVYNESPSTITATLKNCDVENCSVTCTSYDFCTAGMVAFVYEGDNDRIQFENCTVKDVQLYAKPNGYASHAAIYVNDADTDDCFNEAPGVTVTNVTFTAL